jgi:iron complex transport system substrate-binding protein
MRVVALSCSNTEIVCALGCADFLVGVDDHSDFPADVIGRLPKVGPDLGIDIDKVAALNPDLVLASLTVPGHEQIVAALVRSGLNYVAPEPVSLEDVYRDIRDIAALLEVPQRGQEIIDRMRTRIQPATGSICRPTLLVQWWPKPVIAPGGLSWVHDLLEAAGARNPLADRAVKSTPLSDEQVAAINADAMILSWCGVKPDKYRPDVIYRRQSWQHLQLVKKKRVYCIPEAYLGRPSPRLLDGYLSLRRIVSKLQQET